MITVIIPTMWRAPHTLRLLQQFNEHPSVGEIILIDNDTSKTKQEIFSNSKLVYLPQKENQFVNPSWNLGVKTAKYDRLCICNDDCLVNLKFLAEFEKHITPDKGLIGFTEASFLHDRSDTFDKFDAYRIQGFGDEITLVERPDPMPHICYGVCMFVHKDSYHEIPSDFKVDFGDLFVYVLNKFKYSKKNYAIDKGLILTKMSCTGADFADHKEQERKIFYDVFKRYGLE